MILGGCLGVGKRSARTETSIGFTPIARTWTSTGPGRVAAFHVFVDEDFGPHTVYRTAFMVSPWPKGSFELMESTVPRGRPVAKR